MFRTLLLFLTFSPDSIHKWPVIQSFDNTFTFSSPKQMYLKFPVRDVSGKTAYIVECLTPQNEHARRDRAFAFSGQFECRVAIPGEMNLPESQLLVEDENASREWMSRGRFFWRHLVGDCRTYPDFGAVRRFLFRDMEFTIAIRSDVKLGPPTADEDSGFEHSIQALTVRLEGHRYPAKRRSLDRVNGLSRGSPRS